MISFARWPRNIISVSASLIVGWALFLILWYYSGARQATVNGWNDLLIGDSLFYRQFLPNTLLIALVVGITAGLLVGKRRLRRPGMRAAVAILILCLSVFPLFSKHLREASAVAEIPSIVLFLFLVVALIRSVVPFIILALILYVPAAILGSAVGASLSGVGDKKRRSAICSVYLIAFAVILGHGLVTRPAIKAYEQQFPIVRKAIERDLVYLSSGRYELIPQFSGLIRPQLHGARYGGYLFGPRLMINLLPDGTLRSAKLVYFGYEGDTSNDEIRQFLLKIGVREPMVEKFIEGGEMQYVTEKYSIDIIR